MVARQPQGALFISASCTTNSLAWRLLTAWRYGVIPRRCSGRVRAIKRDLAIAVGEMKGSGCRLLSTAILDLSSTFK